MINKNKFIPYFDMHPLPVTSKINSGSISMPDPTFIPALETEWTFLGKIETPTFEWRKVVLHYLPMAERDRRTMFILLASFSNFDFTLRFPVQSLITLSVLHQKLEMNNYILWQFISNIPNFWNLCIEWLLCNKIHIYFYS